MNKRNKFLFKNIGILTVSNFASKIMIFLLVPLYTSVLSTKEYGIYDLIISTASLLLPLLTLNIADAVMRFSMDNSCSKEEIATIGVKYISFSFCIVGLMLIVLQVLNIFPDLKGLKVFIFLYFISYVLNQFLIQFAKGIERVKEMGVAGVMGTAVMLVANIVFVIVLKTGLTGFLVSSILAQFVPVIYFLIKLRFWNYINLSFLNKKLEKQMLVYCVPLIFTVVGWWVNSAADRYVVTFICGVAANGILSVSYKIPSIINTLQNIFIQAWQISVIKEYGENDVVRFYGKTFLYFNVAMSAACSWLIILSKPIAHILYAKEFYVAWQYVPFLLISSVINASSGFIGPILAAKKDSKSMAMSAVYGATANIIMNIVFVYIVGVQGATIATVISSYIIYFFRKRAVKNELVIEQYWKVILTWLLLVVQAIIEIYFSAWYAEVIVMLVLLVLNWNILIDAIRIFTKKKQI